LTLRTPLLTCALAILLRLRKGWQARKSSLPPHQRGIQNFRLKNFRNEEYGTVEGIGGIGRWRERMDSTGIFIKFEM